MELCAKCPPLGSHWSSRRNLHLQPKCEQGLKGSRELLCFILLSGYILAVRIF